MCHSKPGTHVHHKIHLDEWNVEDLSIAIGEDNLILVCQDCHNQIHFKASQGNGLQCLFDEHGNVVNIIESKR